MTPLAYTPSPEFWALMGLLATALIKLASDWQARRQARLDREETREAEAERRDQDRKDLLAVASIAAADRNAVEQHLDRLNKAGSDRLKALLQSNATTRQYTKRAIDTANNTNEKIAILGKALVESKTVPQDVHVVNPAADPVQTKEAE